MKHSFGSRRLRFQMTYEAYNAMGSGPDWLITAWDKGTIRDNGILRVVTAEGSKRIYWGSYIVRDANGGIGCEDR